MRDSKVLDQVDRPANALGRDGVGDRFDIVFGNLRSVIVTGAFVDAFCQIAISLVCDGPPQNPAIRPVVLGGWNSLTNLLNPKNFSVPPFIRRKGCLNSISS